MFIQYHAADYETASRRARQRWADNIDRLLADSPADRPTLRQVHDILVDPRVEVQTSDLHELVRVLRDGSVPANRTEPLDAFVASYADPA
jgi:hypothetical protein